NVILGERGPVVIDWVAAGGGEGADDIAMTWVILAASQIPAAAPARLLMRAGRRVFLDAFLSRAGRAAAAERLPRVAALRLRDPHLLESERRAVEALAR